MAEKSKNEKNPVLSFEGKEYDLKSLSDETKEWVRGIQVADSQIRMQQDSLKVLALGRQTMIIKLKESLKGKKPIT